VIPKSVMNKSSTVSVCSSNVGPEEGAMLLGTKVGSVDETFITVGAREGDSEGAGDKVLFPIEGLAEGVSVVFAVANGDGAAVGMVVELDTKTEGLADGAGDGTALGSIVGMVEFATAATAVGAPVVAVADGTADATTDGESLGAKVALISKKGVGKPEGDPDCPETLETANNRLASSRHCCRALIVDRSTRIGLLMKSGGKRGVVKVSALVLIKYRYSQWLLFSNEQKGIDGACFRSR
jgi:hypothetical protein